ncbi:hypothetical protein EV363DRAFT_1302161 [Boletus edulis]|nr:hypothetical protein EV363DRAFT_1302161 [Boletus edulis]
MSSSWSVIASVVSNENIVVGRPVGLCCRHSRKQKIERKKRAEQNEVEVGLCAGTLGGRRGRKWACRVGVHQARRRVGSFEGICANDGYIEDQASNGCGPKGARFGPHPRLFVPHAVYHANANYSIPPSSNALDIRRRHHVVDNEDAAASPPPPQQQHRQHSGPTTAASRRNNQRDKRSKSCATVTGTPPPSPPSVWTMTVDDDHATRHGDDPSCIVPPAMKTLLSTRHDSTNGDNAAATVSPPS